VHHHIFPTNAAVRTNVTASSAKRSTFAVFQRGRSLLAASEVQEDSLAPCCILLKTSFAALFDPYFTILDIETIEIYGKPDSHLANYCFMERKSAGSITARSPASTKLTEHYQKVSCCPHFCSKPSEARSFARIFASQCFPHPVDRLHIPRHQRLAARTITS